jgi:hypothetical protein
MENGSPFMIVPPSACNADQSRTWTGDRLRNVETVGWRVNVGMVETARAAVFRQVNMTE